MAVEKSDEFIRYKPNIKKIIEVMLYITRKLSSVDRYKLVKLIYLADVKHLNEYWRPITYDSMIAMKNGPVPSATYNILKRDKRFTSYNIDYDDLPFDFINLGKHDGVGNPKREVNTKIFSKSDLEVLDCIIDEYKDASFQDLYDLTHKHIGYKRAWESRGDNKGNPIRYEDLVEESWFKADLVDNMRATCRHVF